MATLLKANGAKVELLPKNGVKFSLEEMQSIVEGYIEFLRLPDGRTLVLNEEGKLLDMPRNPQADKYGRMAGIADNDYIVGPALLCTPQEVGDNEEDEDDD